MTNVEFLQSEVSALINQTHKWTPSIDLVREFTFLGFKVVLIASYDWVNDNIQIFADVCEVRIEFEYNYDSFFKIIKHLKKNIVHGIAKRVIEVILNDKVQ